MAQAAAPEATQFLNDDVLGLICRWLEAPDTRRRTERAGLAKAASRTDDCTNSRPLSQETGVWARHDAARSRPRPQAARGTPALAPLVAAARVCRAFNKAATPSIYFLLELDVLDSRQLAKLARTLAPKDAADEAVKARAEELAAMVRHLRVRNAGSASSEVLRIVRAVAPHLFALDLSRARLRGWPLHRAPPILEAFPEQGAQLRALNLTLADWDYNERGASKILKLVTERFPNLEFLSLDNCGPVSGTSIVRVMTALPRLKDFKFGSRHLLFSAKQWLALQKAMLAKHSTAADYLEWTEAHKFAHIDFSMESISDRDFREFDPWSLAVLIAATFPVGSLLWNIPASALTNSLFRISKLCASLAFSSTTCTRSRQRSLPRSNLTPVTLTLPATFPSVALLHYPSKASSVSPNLRKQRSSINASWKPRVTGKIRMIHLQEPEACTRTTSALSNFLLSCKHTSAKRSIRCLDSKEVPLVPCR